MRTPKDWGQPCPNPECVHYNRMQQGNVSAIATYLTQSGTRRIFRCHTCETQFSETRETVFFDLRTAEDKVMMALKMLLVRVDLTGICFVLGVTEETVLAWLRRAAHQAEAINRHLLRNLPVTQVQLDEMWNFIARKHARETDEAGESLPEGEDGRQWLWVRFVPEFRLMIAALWNPWRGSPKAYRIFVAMPALPALKCAPSIISLFRIIPNAIAANGSAILP